MTVSCKISVLLVDDHPVVRDGYRLLLQNSPGITVVGDVGTGEQACELYGKLAPDVVVLDLSMAGMGGLEAIRRLIMKDPNVRIMVFSMHDSQTMVQRALEAGAVGFLSKFSDSSQMVEAVRRIAQGKTYFDEHLLPKVVGVLSGKGDPLRDLTQREFEVFRNLANGRSVAEIADALCISPKTVGVHQTNILKKLNVRNASELTRLAIRCQVVNP